MLTCDISNASVFLTNISYINHDKKYDSKLWRNEEHTRVSNCFSTNDHGPFLIHIQDPSEEILAFRVNMIFGNTELKVTAFDEKSGAECATILDLI